MSIHFSGDIYPLLYVIAVLVFIFAILHWIIWRDGGWIIRGLLFLAAAVLLFWATVQLFNHKLDEVRLAGLPPVATATAAPDGGQKPDANQTSTPAPNPTRATDADGCSATPHDYNGTSPTIVVESGHQVMVDFWVDGGPEEYTILTEGSWSPNANVSVGSTWDYPGCPAETVQAFMETHAAKRASLSGVNSSGDVVDPSQGFSN